MSRNFCGFVDLSGDLNPSITKQIASKLNINNHYSPSSIRFSKAHLENLYSPRFPKPVNNSFVDELKDKYGIVSYSMLINRKELSQQLEIGNELNRPDEEFILRAFLKWGKELVHHLLGDWAFAIWDNENQELFIARNAHGDATLFYYQKGSKIYFSTLLTGLVNIEGIPVEWDKEKFFMESMTLSGFKTKTIYKDIHFLQPAHTLSFSSRGIKTHQYWHPFELQKRIFKNDEDYFEAYFEAFDLAVKKRLDLRDKWRLSISGGLDSSAMLSVASDYYRQKGGKVDAMCYVPTDTSFKEYNSQTEYGNEKEYAQEIANFNGNVDLNWVQKDSSIWECMISYTRDFDTPPHTQNIWFADALIQNASESNANFVMIAQGGNQGLSFEGVPSSTSWNQLRRDIQNGLNLTSEEHLKFALKSVVGSGKRVLVQQPIARKRRIQNFLENKSLLSKSFIDEVQGYDLLEEHFYGNANKEVNYGEFQLKNRLQPGQDCRLGTWGLIATRYDVLITDPTRDKALLELLASYPNHIFNRKGEPKFLYKKTFENKVPSKILYNKRTGINLSDLVKRYQKDIELIKSLVNSRSIKFDNDMLDAEKVSKLCNALEYNTEFSEQFVKELRAKSSSLFHALLI